MSVDVLFIHPGDQKQTYQDLAKEFTAIAVPVWASLLANSVRSKGYSTAIYDTNVEGWDQNVAKQLAETYNPDLIVIMVYGHGPSASTQTMLAARRVANSVKNFNEDIPLAMGGLHPSALPERTLREESVDFIIRGEAVYTIDGLIRYIKGKSKIEDVKGLCYWRNDSVELNQPAQLIENLDEDLPDYAWDLLPDLNKYRAHNMHCFQDFQRSKRDDFSDVRSPYVSIQTSLGCPYSCHYCCVNSLFGAPGIRYWSLEKVLSWIDTIVNQYGVRNIRIDDELFILSPKRVERFCDMIIERGYDLNLWAHARIDTIREPLLKKLKTAGVNWICLGIESANERVRRNVNKDIKSSIKDVVRQIQEHNIYVVANYMFGLPEDNLETMEETLKFAMDLNCEYATLNGVMAFPGSLLYESASKKKGMVAESWEGFSHHSFESQPMPTRFLTPVEVLTFRDEAFNIYYSSEKYLNMIDRKFGNKVRRHIEKMLTIKIKRRLVSNNGK